MPWRVGRFHVPSEPRTDSVADDAFALIAGDRQPHREDFDEPASMLRTPNGA
jgi:hypothetical protein